MGDVVLGTAILVVVFGPVVMQAIRTFWPVRLNAACTGFTGIYSRYHLDIVTGEVRGFQDQSDKIIIGDIYATVSSSGEIYDVQDYRKTFQNSSTMLLLKDAAGQHTQVTTINMDLMVAPSDVVSVARLRHGGKSGYVVMLYNHTTGLVYQENLRRTEFVTKGSLAHMIMRLHKAYVVILFIAIVTAPLIIAMGIGAQLQFSWFRKHGSKRLIAALGQRDPGQVAAAAPSPAAPVPTTTVPDPPPPTIPASWHPDPTGRHEQRYWDGQRWTDHVADGGQGSTDPTTAELT